MPLARALIGKILVRELPTGELLTGRIVETEAYTLGDPSSHAFRGPTQRNASMFKRHLHAYVYFIYGSAFCLNISSEAEGTGAAVLIRAIEPLTGIETMRTLRGPTIKDRDLARGPGRLCAAFAITKSQDTLDLETDQTLWLATDTTKKFAIGTSPRIGLSKEQSRPHRFYLKSSPHLSGPRKLSP